jgi:penicillin amidase
MPQVRNPASGWVANCNNDPVGTTLDNNALNQLRPGGGLYYLNPGYAPGFRMGRIRRLIEDALAAKGTAGGFTPADFKAFQANHQLLDAEVLVPYVLAAFGNAGAAGAPAPLADLGADPGVAEAVGLLAAWDFSTPTGLAAGFDPGDDPAALPQPSEQEIAASVAATVYAAWRGQVVPAVIDATLERVDAAVAALGVQAPSLADLAPGSNQALAALRNLLDTFPARQGFGASGLDFFAVPGVADRGAARDVVLLQCLRDALDLLASDAFAPAFGNSTDLLDYRWGYLHRIEFDHILGDPFSIPAAGGLADLGPGLPGVARSGGLGALDASSHGARADGLNEFMFGSGPARRFVGEVPPSGPVFEQVIPGGESGILNDAFQSDQLLLWLTNGYKTFFWQPGDVIRNIRTYQQFLPP